MATDIAAIKAKIHAKKTGAASTKVTQSAPESTLPWLEIVMGAVVIVGLVWLVKKEKENGK